MNTNQIRKIAVVLDGSGTLRTVRNTKLYVGSFGFVGLQCYVPAMESKDGDFCQVYRTSIDSAGNRVQGRNYSMPYVEEVELDGAKYKLYERMCPREFTETEGELELVFNYVQTKRTDIPEETTLVADAVLTTGVFRTTVTAGGWNNAGIDDPALDPTSQTAVQIDLNTKQIGDLKRDTQLERDRIESESKSRDTVLETDYKAANMALNARIVPIENTLDSAQQAVKNADEVLVEASQAVVTANKASEAANAISGKVDEAVELATQAKTTADNLDTDIRAKVAELVNSAPETLDTLSELAAALNNDADFAANVTTQLSNKQDKEEGKGLSECDFTAEEKEKLARVVPSLIPEGVWDKTLSYPENAVVAFNGAAYAATVEATTVGANPRDTPEEWKAIIEPTMHNRGDFNASLQYYPGDTVYYGGSSYRCKMKTSPGIAPDLPGNGAWWQLVAKRGEDGYNVWLLKDTKPIPSGSDYPGVNRSDLLPDNNTVPKLGDTVVGFNADKTQLGVGQITTVTAADTVFYVTNVQMIQIKDQQALDAKLDKAGGTITGPLAVTGQTTLNGQTSIANSNNNTYLELGKRNKTGIEFHCQSGDTVLDYDAYIQADQATSSTSIKSAKLEYGARQHNFLGPIFEDNQRVFSPNNKPTAADLGALSSSGGTVGGSLNVTGTLQKSGSNVHTANSLSFSVSGTTLTITNNT